MQLEVEAISLKKDTGKDESTKKRLKAIEKEVKKLDEQVVDLRAVYEKERGVITELVGPSVPVCVAVH